MNKFLAVVVVLCPLLCFTQSTTLDSFSIIKFDSLRLAAMATKSYEDAIQYAEHQMELSSNLHKESSVEFFENKLAYAYTIKVSGQRERAERLYLDVIDGLEEQRLNTSDVYCDVLNNLSFLYMNMSKYELSEEWFVKAIDVIKKVKGEYSSDYYVILNNYGLLQYHKGHYDRAIEEYDRSLCIIEDMEGKFSSEYAHKINNKAGAYFRKGDLFRASKMFHQSKEIAERTDGRISQRYLTVVDNLSYLNRISHDFEKAFYYFRESCAVNFELYGKNSYKNLDLLTNEAGLRYEMNDFEAAKKLMDLYLKKLEEQNLLNSTEVYINYFDKANIEYALGHYDEGYKAIQTAEKLVKEQHGDDFDQLGLIKGTLATFLAQQGKLGLALDARLEAEEILLSTTGEKHRDYISCLNKIGRLHVRLGNLTEARIYINKAKQLKIKYYGSNSQMLISDDINEAILSFAEGDDKKSLDLFKSCLDSRYNYLLKYMRILSYDRRVNLYEDFNFAFNHFLSRFMVDNDPSADLLEYIVAYSRRLSSLAAKVAYLNKVHSDLLSDGDLVEELNATNHQINRYISYDAEKLAKRSINLDSLIEASLAIEEDLLQNKSSEWYIDSLQYSQVGAVEVDFINFQYSSITSSSNAEQRYYSIVSDGAAPTVCHKIQGMESLPNFDGTNPNEDYLKVYKRIFPNSLVDNMNRPLIIRPGGIFYNIPFHALSVNSIALKDAFDLTVLSSENGSNTDNVSGSMALVVGNDFVEREDKEKKSAPQDLLALRGLGLTTQLKPFVPIPMVVKEVANIKSSLRTDDIEVLMNASEAFLKEKLSSNKYKLIHISSHGYFVNSDAKIKQVKKILGSSGIALQEANSFLRNDDYNGEEDGLLTALEVMELPVQNSELVVLSTCQSAKGMVHHREGNMGLHMAFNTLGVKNLVLTLWNVSDEATQEMMTNFYEELSQGNSVRTSYNRSIDLLKSKYSKKVWGAYVLFGVGDVILFPKKHYALYGGLFLLFSCLIFLGKQYLI